MFCYVTYPTLKRKRDSHYYYLTENKAVSVELLGTKTEQCNAVAKRYTKTGQILMIWVALTLKWAIFDNLVIHELLELQFEFIPPF